MMLPAVAMSAPPVSAVGYGRIAVKVAAMLSLFALVVPLIYLNRAMHRPCPWPRRLMAAITWIIGVKLRITGQRPDGNEFLVANHVSWIDIAAISAASGASFIANDGLAQHPFTRWMCAMNGAILIARHDRNSVQNQIEQVRAALNNGGVLAIFPEGTTSDGMGLLPFKSSLLSALDPLPSGVAVQPVLLDYGPKAAEMAWVGEESGLDNFKRLLAQSEPISLHMHFLPPLTADALINRKSIAQATRSAILNALQATRD